MGLIISKISPNTFTSAAKSGGRSYPTRIPSSLISRQLNPSQNVTDTSISESAEMGPVESGSFMFTVLSCFHGPFVRFCRAAYQVNDEIDYILGSHSSSDSNTSNNHDKELGITFQKRLQQIGTVHSYPANTPLSHSSRTATNHMHSANLQSTTPSHSPQKISSTLNMTEDMNVESPSASSPIIYPKLSDGGQDSTTNSAIRLIAARKQFDIEAEAEFATIGKSGYQGRRFLDVGTIRQILTMRDTQRELKDEEIERKLGLHAGVVRLLGKRNVVSVIK